VKKIKAFLSKAWYAIGCGMLGMPVDKDRRDR
jgi:hypothetical protein